VRLVEKSVGVERFGPYPDEQPSPMQDRKTELTIGRIRKPDGDWLEFSPLEWLDALRRLTTVLYPAELKSFDSACAEFVRDLTRPQKKEAPCPNRR